MGTPTNAVPKAAVAQTRSVRDKHTPTQPVAAPLPVLSRQQAISGKLSRTTGYIPAESLVKPAVEPPPPVSLPPVDQPSEPAVVQPPKPTTEEIFAAKPLFKYESRKVGPSGAMQQARSRKTR